MNAKLYSTHATSGGEGVVGKLVCLGAAGPAKSALWTQVGGW